MAVCMIKAVEAPMQNMSADAWRELRAESPAVILTQEVLAHDTDKLDRLLAQFKRGMMTANEYAQFVCDTIAERQRFIMAEEL